MSKKKLIWVVLFLLIAGLSIWTITSQCSSFSFKELCDDIVNANKPLLILSFICMLGFIYFEGLSLCTIIKELYPEKYKRHGILYSTSDIYFSAITPSASGGQPASAYFMMRDGVPGSIAMIVLIVNLIMYVLSLMITGLICIIFRYDLLASYDGFAKLLIVIGYVVLAGLVAAFFLLLFHDTLFSKIANTVFKILIKLHLLHNEERRRAKLNNMIDDYRECSKAISGKKKMLIKVFCINMLQRLSQISVSMFVFLSVGGPLKKAFDVWVIQGLTLVGANCIPIPGAMGAADYLLIEGFSHVPEIESTANLELLCRGISFYSCTILSGIIVLIGYFVIRKVDNDRLL